MVVEQMWERVRERLVDMEAAASVKDMTRHAGDTIAVPEMTNAEPEMLLVRMIGLEKPRNRPACHGIRSTARSGSRNGGLHLSSAVLCPLSADPAGGGLLIDPR